jgi:hypothetical protein
MSYAAIPTFQDLMNPALFPEAQQGMKVENATVSEDTLHVVTTGADFTLDKSGHGVFRQRIGHEREVVRINIKGITRTPQLTHKGPGFAFATFYSPKLDLRTNGDSLFMFHAQEPVTLDIERVVDVGFSAIDKGNALILDEWGGFGLFCSDDNFGKTVSSHESNVIRYILPANAVLWLGICPPKPYNWERSLKDNVIWHWSSKIGYPADSDLISWAKEGNIVLLQSEVMLWKDWNLAFEARLGEAEFARVRKTIHQKDMRFIVYTSPYYYLRGTPYEFKAMNSFDNFKITGFPPGWPKGNNIDLFIDEIRKVMTKYKPDGLYFDGQYFENVPALYALARRARDVVGEDGILEWHSTTALGNSLCFLPQADAYVDFILRGEGRESSYANDDYMRYFVSGYNTSNSIGVIGNNNSKPTSLLLQRLLAMNIRMHTVVNWLGDRATMDIIHTNYTVHLTPALRAQVDKSIDTRQAAVAKRSKQRLEARHVLNAPPVWGKPQLTFRSLDFLKWRPSISPKNISPFSMQNGSLAITAKAHTYAFLSTAIDTTISGLTVKIKQHTDSGASWGPAISVRWKNGTWLIVGLRSDGTLQINSSGAPQQLIGKHNPKEWIWVRTRWVNQEGIIETSTDGTTFQRIWTFQHANRLDDPLESIAVGKGPFIGKAVDYSEPGPEGMCLIESLNVY